MVILGIDPGLAIVGFGVLRREGNKLVHLRHGVIRTEAGLPLEQRLATIFDDMSELFSVFAPDCVAMEELFFGNNVTTGIAVSHARGVILLAAARAGLFVTSYKPAQVKMAVVGYGSAEKPQIMEMTRRLLDLKELPRPDDAADALAVAICHANTMRG